MGAGAVIHIGGARKNGGCSEEKMSLAEDKITGSAADPSGDICMSLRQVVLLLKPIP